MGSHIGVLKEWRDARVSQAVIVSPANTGIGRARMHTHAHTHTRTHTHTHARKHTNTHTLTHTHTCIPVTHPLGKSTFCMFVT